jgi:hypothetical protein
MVAVNAGVLLLFGTMRLLGPGGRRALILVSALVLAALGICQLVISIAVAGVA